MKEFVSAISDIEYEDQRREKIDELIAQGKTEEEAEKQLDDEEGLIAFKLDDVVLKAYPPTDGQLTFMLASLGRGQTTDQRFASIINIMMSCLRDEDQDYLESRLLTRNHRERLGVKQIEEIFEYLVGEWFARPTQSPSDSAQ